jgi:GAF domain-containing protein
MEPSAMVEAVDLGALDAASALRALAGIVLGEHSFEAVLERATDVAKRAIPGAAEVSVTMQDGHPTTVAASGALAVRVDEHQYEVGAGPCLHAIRTASTVMVDDQKSDARWPEYAVRAVAAGVGSSLSVPLAVDATVVGAFNAYATEPNAFDGDARTVAEDLAAFAGIVLNNAGLYFTAASRAEQMVEAMASRAEIEQAKGILMAGRRCGADEAFEILVRLSQQSHRKLRDVAQALVNSVTEAESSTAG